MADIVETSEAELQFRKRPVAKVTLFISQSALEMMIDHVETDTDVEIMGLMTGRRFKDDDGIYAIIDGTATSDLISDECSVKFDKRAMSQLFDTVDSLPEDGLILGWYHSHPGFGCFMSDTDVRTHDGIFGNDCGFAMVIDPIKQEMKAFGKASEEVMFIIMEN